MPITRQGMGKDKKVDMKAGERIGRSPPNPASQYGVETEFTSRAPSPPPSPGRPQRREVSPDSPVNVTRRELQDLRNAVQMLTQIVVAQSQGRVGPVTSDDGASRIASRRTQDFLKLNPPTFIGSDLNEDLQIFIEQIQRALHVMHVTGVETVELAAYRLK